MVVILKTKRFGSLFFLFLHSFLFIFESVGARSWLLIILGIFVGCILWDNSYQRFYHFSPFLVSLWICACFAIFFFNSSFMSRFSCYQKEVWEGESSHILTLEIPALNLYVKYHNAIISSSSSDHPLYCCFWFLLVSSFNLVNILTHVACI